MTQQKNFFQRAVDAIVAGRTLQAERYVAQYRREHGLDQSKVNPR